MRRARGANRARNFARRRSALVIALFSSLGGFLFGVDIGYISGVEVMASFRDDLNDGRPMDDATMGMITAIFALGALAAASPPANEALMRAMSRRSALVAGAATFCVGATIQGLSFSVPSVLVGRLVSGASIGVLSTNVPVYMSELAAADERGGRCRAARRASRPGARVRCGPAGGERSHTVTEARPVRPQTEVSLTGTTTFTHIRRPTPGPDA